jgi:hypothetical protein
MRPGLKYLSSYIIPTKLEGEITFMGLISGPLFHRNICILGILPSLEKLALFKLLGRRRIPSWPLHSKSPANPPFDNYFLENYH